MPARDRRDGQLRRPAGLGLEDAARTRVVEELTRLYLQDVEDALSRRAVPGALGVRRSSPSCGAKWSPDADAAALATIRQPALLVAAAHSPAELREPFEVLAATLPNARKALVGGGQLIDPAAPEVLAFIEEVLGQVTTQAILLPGGVMPAALACGCAARRTHVQAVAKELEIYADAAPPAGYTLQHAPTTDVARGRCARDVPG